MIDTHARARWEDISSFESSREGTFRLFDRMVDEYCGPYFDGKTEMSGGGGENHPYQWISTMKSQIVAGNPRWIFTSEGGSQLDPDLMTGRLAMNRWSVETRLRRTLQNCFTDWAFLYAVAVLTRAPQPHITFGADEVPALWPEARRVSPKAHGWDPMATTYHEARVKWHKYIADLEDLVTNAEAAPKEDGWNVKALRDLKPSEQGMDKLRPKQNGASMRRDIVCYDVYVPEEQLPDEPGPEEGYNGTFHTYALASPKDRHRSDESAGELTEIRRPRPAFCAPGGPYVMCGMDYVPDRAQPLSHMLALQAEMISLGVTERVIDMAMRNYKKLIVVNARDPDLPQLVKDTTNNGIIALKNFQGKQDIFEAEIGGLTQQMASHYEFRRNMLDRKSGFSDAQRSMVTGDATATENAIASASADARTSGYREAWYDFPKGIGTKAWYMIQRDEQALIPLDPQGAAEMGFGPQQAVAYGGGDGRIDVAIDVEPKSMTRRSEASEQHRAMTLHQIAVQDAVTMLQAPHLNWRARHKKLGLAFDEPDFPEEFNYELAGAIAGAMLQAQLAGGTETGSPREQPTTTAQAKQPPAKQLGSAQPAPKQPSLPGQSSGQKARQGPAKAKASAA